jgi:endonuclease/exonuclease/phosphatase family metal-dependent hydrolase
MRLWLLLTVALGACGSGRGTAPSAVVDGGQRLTVVTWNVQQSRGAMLEAQVGFLSGLQADLIAVQETTAGEFENFRSLLGQRTGLSWAARYAPAVRRLDGTRGGGIAVFTSLPILEAEAMLMDASDRWTTQRAAQRVRVTHPPSGVTLDVFATHLSPGEDARDSRQRQVDELMRAARRSNVLRVLGGDLNAEPTTEEIASASTPHGAGVAAEFVDVWPTAGRGAGDTFPADRPTRRIDYWFVARSAQPMLTPAEASVLDVCGGRSECLSDHRPLRVVFRVRP